MIVDMVEICHSSKRSLSEVFWSHKMEQKRIHKYIIFLLEKVIAILGQLSSAALVQVNIWQKKVSITKSVIENLSWNRDNYLK